MDHRGQPMYGNPRMSMMEQSCIDSVPGSNPIDNSVENNAQETMVMPDATMSDNHATITGMSGEPMSDNHATITGMSGEPMSDNHDIFTHITHLNNIPVQQNYSQLALRKEVDDEGRICGVVLPETLDQVTKKGNDSDLEEGLQEEIKSEEEDDISNFMESAHDIFLKISSKELKIKAAADILGRPYSFVYTRYQEFCDNITGDIEEITSKNKKAATINKDGKKMRRAKKLNWGSNRPRKKLKCEECPAVFPTEYKLRNHIKLHEEEIEPHTCTVCGMIFAKITQLMHHRIDVHEEALQCPHCNMTFTLISSYRTHVKSHSSERPYVCKECGKGYLAKLHLEYHIRTHTGERPFMCGYCEKAFITLHNLKGHVLKIHTDSSDTVNDTGEPRERKEKKFECGQCERKFECNSALIEHVNVHTGAKPYVCDLCDVRFNHKAALRLHKMKHTGEQPKRRKPLRKRIRKKKDKKFECEQCERKYDSNNALIQHMNIHTGAMPYACDLCDARFNFKTGLNHHKVTHTGVQPYKCDLCPAAFYKKKGLDQHKVVHTGVKPYKCDLCDYACTRKETLEYHKYTHTGETPFKCDYYGCTAEYAKPGSLRHHKLQHGQPPKTCKVCCEKFQDLISLKRHMMIHTGEKPVSCEQCSKVFYEKSSLKRHMYSHLERPPGSKTKQVRQSRKNPVVKKPDTFPTSQKTWESEYQVPLAENGHNIFAQSMTETVQNTNNQPSYHNLTASQYSTMVNNLWPSTIDSDEFRHRLLSSYK